MNLDHISYTKPNLAPTAAPEQRRPTIVIFKEVASTQYLLLVSLEGHTEGLSVRLQLVHRDHPWLVQLTRGHHGNPCPLRVHLQIVARPDEIWDTCGNVTLSGEKHDFKCVVVSATLPFLAFFSKRTCIREIQQRTYLFQHEKETAKTPARLCTTLILPAHGTTKPRNNPYIATRKELPFTEQCRCCDPANHCWYTDHDDIMSNHEQNKNNTW